MAYSVGNGVAASPQQRDEGYMTTVPTFAATSPIRPIVSTKTKTPLSRSPGRSPNRQYGSIAFQSSPPPPPPPSQHPRRPLAKNVSVLETELMDQLFASSAHSLARTTPTLRPPSYTTAQSSNSSHSSSSVPLSTSSTSSAAAATYTSASSPLGQLPVLRGCTFFLFRILLFPKTIFVRTVAVGRGCLGRVGLHRGSGGGGGGRRRSPHRHLHEFYPHSHHHSHLHPPTGNELNAPPPFDQPYPTRRRRRPSGSLSPSSSRSRSRSAAGTRYRSNAGSSQKYISRACCTSFLNSYKVQVAMVCLCLTGESFAQSVMCPFLYYMVRDFHVGPDIWIGYYAGLLWTGFWGANLCTTLFWGYLSDRYGRKVILLFGLFMTSLSTLYLGLASCYHDAMWALVIQGACTGLVPVSKCTIGEMANRQQRIHDTELLLQEEQLQQQRQHRQYHSQYREWKDQDPVVYNDKETGEDDACGLNNQHPSYQTDAILCSDPYCRERGDDVEYHREILQGSGRKTPEDFASKGYSALVIALALGGALGPLAGGSLTKKQIPGFESYQYLAPCLLAALVGLFLTGAVALIMNETHPKWVKEAVIDHRVDSMSVSNQGHDRMYDGTRGRPGYEQSRRYLSQQVESGPLPHADSEMVNEKVATPVSASVSGSSGSGAGSTRVPPTTTRPGLDDRLSVNLCTCSRTPAISGQSAHSTPVQSPSSAAGGEAPLPATAIPPLAGPSSSSLTGTAITTTTTNAKAKAKATKPTQSWLSPATELYLILGIYTLLVLTSILGSEFVMLYTQSPLLRGGLEFSAKILGQVLTMRGILKLTFNLLGYPWMVKRFGLLVCLRMGIVTIGMVSVFGLGWFVPWTVERDTLAEAFSHEHGQDHGVGGTGPVKGLASARPIGMGVVLLCLSMISMGDVLGYISVLVLFGKSADRLKGAGKTSTAPIDLQTNNNNNTVRQGGNVGQTVEDKQTGGPSQGGSGVLWSVAQVSANVMRLAGPVLAGLLWSLTEKSGLASSSSSKDAASFPSAPLDHQDQHHHDQHAAPASYAVQATFLTPALGDAATNGGGIFGSAGFGSHGRATIMALANSIFSGPTSVFYLVGAICILNFVACQFLVRSHRPVEGEDEEEDGVGGEEGRMVATLASARGGHLEPPSSFDASSSMPSSPSLPGRRGGGHSDCVLHPGQRQQRRHSIVLQSV